METYTDRSPDHIFIKLNVKAFRSLVQSASLTHAEIGALVVLACRIGENNTCFQSKETAAQDAGKKSRANIQRLHKSLKDKGALDWTPDPQQNASHIYTLPSCFNFGTDSYQNPNSERGGVCNSERGGVCNCVHSDDPTAYTKENCFEEDPFLSRSNNKQQQHPEKSEIREKIHALASDAEIVGDLLRAGVRDKEAEALTNQFRQRIDVLYEAIQAAAKARKQNKYIANPGAWIVARIERRTCEKLHYQNSPMATRPNPYLADPYFEKQQQRWDEILDGATDDRAAK